jgi:hypothetical protein
VGGKEEGEREWEGKKGEMDDRGIEQRERGRNGREGKGRGGKKRGGEGMEAPGAGPPPPKIFGLEPPLVRRFVFGIRA